MPREKIVKKGGKVADELPVKVITTITYLDPIGEAIVIECERVEYLTGFVKAVKAKKMDSDVRLVIPNGRILLIREDIY